MAKQISKIKKGDSVQIVGKWNQVDIEGDIVLYFHDLKVTSFGKVQGTATNLNDENIKHFIGPGMRDYTKRCTHFLVKKGEDSTPHFNKIKEMALESLKRSIVIQINWLDQYENTAKPHIVESARQKLKCWQEKIKNPVFVVRDYYELIKEI